MRKPAPENTCPLQEVLFRRAGIRILADSEGEWFINRSNF
jgi:hypothetical protein